MTARVLIMDAGALQCRRPLWAGAVPLSEKFVCGAPVRKAGESWCADCCKQLFDPLPMRRADRSAPRLARVPRFQAIHSSSWSAG